MYTERLEDYQVGKYHPVHLGDKYQNARYKIIRKLGHGSFSTVWLARDSRISRYVAVKIAHANSSARDEKRIYELLAGSKLLNHPGRNHYLPLKSEFTIKGPNGVHQCLVYEPMAGSVTDVKEKEFGNHPFPLRMAKSILWQTLLGLDYLLEHGIAHGDVQPRNLLFMLGDLAHVPERQLVQPGHKRFMSVRSLYRKRRPWKSHYLVSDESLMKYLDITSTFTIKITDLGGAFFTTAPPSKSTPPLSLRSPEAIYQGLVTERQDMWSFGCLIFEFITGEPLFHVTHFGGTKECDDGQLLDMYNFLGFPANDALRDAQWPAWRTYFSSSGECIKNYIGERVDQCDSVRILPPLSLEQRFDESLPEGFPPAEGNVIKVLLRGLLQFDPTRRLTTKQLMEHPWFARERLNQTL